MKTFGWKLNLVLEQVKCSTIPQTEKDHRQLPVLVQDRFSGVNANAACYRSMVRDGLNDGFRLWGAHDLHIREKPNQDSFAAEDASAPEMPAVLPWPGPLATNFISRNPSRRQVHIEDNGAEETREAGPAHNRDNGPLVMLS